MIPEFIGRLPVIAPLMPLSVDTMIHILTEPKNAIVRQYQHLFTLENAKLTFTDKALEAIATRAAKRDTGARGLRAVMEEIMTDLMFELPDLDNHGVEYVIDESVVKRPRTFRLQDLRVKHKETA
jgi:ATP-dependent Clp protease ATP-binding subunit ClpX